MSNKARVTRQKLVNGSTESQSDEEVDVSTLLGDRGATIGRSRTVSQGISLEYGAYKVQVSDTCTVNLTCNQDRDSIDLAEEEAKSLVNKYLSESFSKSTALMRKLINKYVESNG